MTTLDIAGAIRRDRASVAQRLSFVGAAARQFDWLRELPGVFLGLWILAKPFRLYLILILAMNGVIAMLQAQESIGVATVQDALTADASWKAVLYAVFFPVLWILIGELVLQIVRDAGSGWLIEPGFMLHVGRTCLKRRPQNARIRDADIEGKIAPILHEGRDSALAVLISLAREPAFAARGAYILVSVFFVDLPLALFIAGGLVLQFFATCAMNWVVGPLCDVQNARQFDLKALEFESLDGNLKNAESESAYEKQGAAFAPATVWARVMTALFSTGVRMVVPNIVRFGCMILLAVRVMQGECNIGEFGYALSYWLCSGDPVNSFFNLQQQIMTTREQLRRLGVVTGINFGLKKKVI
jgi:hypothetical protein